MKNKKKIFYVKVETLGGREAIFQLPKDLQQPMRIYCHDHPKDWQNLLLGALINIPMADYTAKNNYQPMISLAWVTGFFYRYHYQKWRTRGQFLTQDNWQTKGRQHFWQTLTFVQHDYPWWIKFRIFWDYYRWRRLWRQGKLEKRKSHP